MHLSKIQPYELLIVHLFTCDEEKRLCLNNYYVMLYFFLTLRQTRLRRSILGIFRHLVAARCHDKQGISA